MQLWRQPVIWKWETEEISKATVGWSWAELRSANDWQCLLWENQKANDCRISLSEKAKAINERLANRRPVDENYWKAKAGFGENVAKLKIESEIANASWKWRRS